MERERVGLWDGLFALVEVVVFYTDFTFICVCFAGSSEGSIEASSMLQEDGCCWVCLEEENATDLFYPCNCKLHRKCIKQWIAKVRVRVGGVYG